MSLETISQTSELLLKHEVSLDPVLLLVKMIFSWVNVTVTGISAPPDPDTVTTRSVSRRIS